MHAHARIGGIDRDAALEVAGVVAVLTASDLPIVGSGPQRRFEPLAIDEIVYAGQPVALVVARTEEAAADAAALVRVDEEALAPVVDVREGARAGIAPHADPRARGRRASSRVRTRTIRDAGSFSGNLVGPDPGPAGRHGRGFGRCDVIVEGTFRAPWAYQAYLEPHAATAWVEPDGTLAVIASTQAIFATRNNLAAIFGLPTARVRVTGRSHRWRVRLEADGDRAARRRGGARASCARPARADPPRGLRLDEAGAGDRCRGPDRRDPGRPAPGAAGPGRLRHRRVLGVVLAHGRGPGPGRPLPLARIRRRRARRPDEPLRRGQLPRADGSAAHPCARDAGRRAGRPARARPRGPAAREPRQRGRSDRARARRGRGSARSNASRRCAATGSGRPGPACRPARGSAWRSGSGRRRWSRPPRPAGSSRTGPSR